MKESPLTPSVFDATACTRVWVGGQVEGGESRTIARWACVVAEWRLAGGLGLLVDRSVAMWLARSQSVCGISASSSLGKLELAFVGATPLAPGTPTAVAQAASPSCYAYRRGPTVGHPQISLGIRVAIPRLALVLRVPSLTLRF